MAADAFIAHQLPRRLRLAAPSRRGDDQFFDDLVRRLCTIPEVEAVRANPAAGSILIAHDGGFDPGSVEDVVRITHAPSTAAPSPRRDPMEARKRNDAVAVGISGLALLQTARGRFTGAASENFWNAYRAHYDLKSTPLTLFSLGLGVYSLLRGNFLNSATALMFYALAAYQLARKAELESESQEGGAGEPPKPPQV